MKALILSLVMLSLNTVAYGMDCVAQIDNKYCVELEWLEGPYMDAYSTNYIQIKDITTEKAVDLPGSVEFKVWMIMDMHSHGGASVLTEKKSTGEYIVDEIYFFTGMEGKWQFKLIHNKNDYVLFEMDI